MYSLHLFSPIQNVRLGVCIIQWHILINDQKNTLKQGCRLYTDADYMQVFRVTRVIIYKLTITNMFSVVCFNRNYTKIESKMIQPKPY